MKIVEIIPQLNSGGAERFTVDLCNELVKDNDVTLIVLSSLEDSGFYASEISPKVKVISLEKRSRVDLSLLFSIRREIVKIKPDVVHTHIRAIIFSLWCILTTKGIKYFHTLHSDAKKEAKGYIFGIIRRYLFKRKIVTPVTISNKSHSSFVDYYKMEAPIIYNGRDIPKELSISDEVTEEFTRYRKDDKTKVLVCLARITPVKRQTMFAKIAKRLSEEGANFALLLIGSTRDTELVEEIKSYDCSDVYIRWSCTIRFYIL